MKKLAALLLALCMMIAALPALADGEVGTWYMTLADVTMGYITLNEDGTAIANMLGSDEMAGTWTAGENAITVTIDGDPVTFAFDGTTMTAEEFPLPLTKEEGKLTMDLMAKVINDEEYELPEGMTKDDLTTYALNFLAEYQKLAGGDEAAAE